MIGLAGRVAIITGAGSGLGRDALLLASRGARVAVNDLDIAPAEAVAEVVHEAGGKAIAVAASVADFDAVQAMTETVLGQWSQVDILINNAGLLRDKNFARMGLSDFRLVVDVHLMGSVNCTKAVWDQMRERN